MRVVEEPAAVGLPLGHDEVHGICDAFVGWKTGVSEVVEGAENVVVVTGRESEFQECRIGHVAGRATTIENTV